MTAETSRYPVMTWLMGALVTVAVAVAVRLAAAVADVAVLVPDPRGGDPEPLGLAPIVVVTLGAFVLAVVVVVALHRLLRDRARAGRIVRIVALVVLALSLVPIFATELPSSSRVVLTFLHLLVGLAVLRTVIRG